MTDLRLTTTYQDMGDQRDAQGRSLGGWRYDVEGVGGERFFATEGQARRAGAAAVEAERKQRHLREVFEPYAGKGFELLDAPVSERVAMTGGAGSGDKCLPFMKGLDVLECFGVRVDEVTAERAHRRITSKRLGKSPWDRPDIAKDRGWIAQLRFWFPDKPWK